MTLKRLICRGGSAPVSENGPNMRPRDSSSYKYWEKISGCSDAEYMFEVAERRGEP